MPNIHDSLSPLRQAQEKAQQVIDAIRREAQQLAIQKSVSTSGETKPSAPTKPLS